MKSVLTSLAVFFICCFAALAQIPVTVIVSNLPGCTIPSDFTGLSFGATAEIEGHGVPGRLFSPTNTQLITLFKNSGLHHLRLGGSTVEGTNAAVPTHEDIDNVFGFAKAADIKVIYSLRLANGDPAVAASDATYIWDHYRSILDSFAIGNEPDIKRYHFPPYGSGSDPLITNYSSYLDRWRIFAAAVTNAVPKAKFSGPDAAGKAWAADFARDEKDSGIVTVITQHVYVGGSPFLEKDKRTGPTIPASEAISNMLSRHWLEKNYNDFFNRDITPIMKEGLPYRMTEADDYLRGVTNASDGYASALWALDFLHWWAAHGCVGVNFHNTEWVRTATVRPAPSGAMEITPKAYGIKAFDIGGHGHVLPVTLDNTNHMHLTAYAVADSKDLFVTLINKEIGDDARTAVVNISLNGFKGNHVWAMFLKAADGNPQATSGITLGDAIITNNVDWAGKWTKLKPVEKGECAVTIPATSAAVVKIKLR